MNQTHIGFDIGLVICLVLVLMLQIYPLDDQLSMWRPHFVLLLCCYIAFNRSVLFALWFACLAGLVTDILFGWSLGKNGLALTISLSLLLIIVPRIKHGGVMHEALVVGLLTLVCELVLQSLNLFVRETIKTAWVIYPALSSLLLWPLINSFFHKLIPVEQD